MAKKKRRHRIVPATIKWIAHDQRQKRKLDEEFYERFYPLMERMIQSKKAPKSLKVPLKRLERSVRAAAYGVLFGSGK